MSKKEFEASECCDAISKNQSLVRFQNQLVGSQSDGFYQNQQILSQNCGFDKNQLAVSQIVNFCKNAKLWSQRLDGHAFYSHLFLATQQVIPKKPNIFTDKQSLTLQPKVSRSQKSALWCSICRSLKLLKKAFINGFSARLKKAWLKPHLLWVPLGR
ncbi:hypothetical protein [Campylobacter hyointestinalis]|uniref:hypothetical protein n=1 Tax=Campylobacter hyointestinalis TaxID=198 RepID=UPI000DCB29D0|nr:hypothetical protein [Campylobacter hyointestinalis]RAZ50832.1 hypothetical protein CHL9004_00830 [Campylobacter hyointestinalis subsp. lawsonii]